MINRIIGTGFQPNLSLDPSSCCCCCNCDGQPNEYGIGSVDGHQFVRYYNNVEQEIAG